MSGAIADRMALLADTRDGVRRLRQLILDLGTRGLLVPQQHDAESADALSRRLGFELSVPDGQSVCASRTLPDSWRWVSLAAVSDLITSGSRDWAQHYADEGAIFVRMGNLSKESYELRLDNIQRVQPPKSAEGNRTRLMTDDLLVSITGDVGMLGLIPEGFGEAYINQHTCVIRFRPELRGRFYPEVLRSPLAKHQFDEPQRGIKNSFRLSDIGQMLVPLPPVEEQQRIVAKVDELMALCDRLEARQQDAETAHARLVQALLDSLTQARDADEFQACWRKLADLFPEALATEAAVTELRRVVQQLGVMGRLTSREPNDGLGLELLAKITAARSKGAASGRQRAKVDDIAREVPYGLPAEWCWSTAEQLCEAIVDCPHSTPKFVPNGVVCLDTNSVKQGRIVPERIRYVDEATYAERVARLTPRPGDVVFSREGSVGESAVVPADLRCCLGQRVMLFRPCLIEPAYLQLALSEPSAVERQLAMHKGIGAKHVNVADMREAWVPLPPLGEQRRIVAKVTELLALCDQLKARIVAARAKHAQVAEALVEAAVA